MNKMRDLLSKTLVVGVIVLFIGMGGQPAIAVFQPEEEINIGLFYNMDKEPYETSKIGEYDNFREIISGFESDSVDIEIKGIGLIRHAEIYAWGNNRIWIDGIKFPTADNPDIDFFVEATHIIAPRFIGYHYTVSPGHEYVHGIALGNIEWELIEC